MGFGGAFWFVRVSLVYFVSFYLRVECCHLLVYGLVWQVPRLWVYVVLHGIGVRSEV